MPDTKMIMLLAVALLVVIIAAYALLAHKSVSTGSTNTTKASNAITVHVAASTTVSATPPIPTAGTPGANSGAGAG